MVDIRELRLAVQKKLEHRRLLLAENSYLRGELEQAQYVSKSHIMNFALEGCADQIITAVLDRAIAASKLVAEQTAEDGDYVVGIDIPSLHIRHRIARVEMGFDKARDVPSYLPPTKIIRI